MLKRISNKIIIGVNSRLRNYKELPDEFKGKLDAAGEDEMLDIPLIAKGVTLTFPDESPQLQLSIQDVIDIYNTIQEVNNKETEPMTAGDYNS